MSQRRSRTRRARPAGATTAIPGKARCQRHKGQRSLRCPRHSSRDPAREATSNNPATPTVVLTHKARELNACAGQPALQDLVHESLRHRQVVERVSQTLSHLRWKRFRPNLGGRLYRVMVGYIEVEVEGLVVERLPRIVVHPLARRWHVRSQGLPLLRIAHLRRITLPGTSDQTDEQDRYNRERKQQDQAPVWGSCVDC